jgi:hypothetical protein
MLCLTAEHAEYHGEFSVVLRDEIPPWNFVGLTNVICFIPPFSDVSYSFLTSVLRVADNGANWRVNAISATCVQIMSFRVVVQSFRWTILGGQIKIVYSFWLGHAVASLVKHNATSRKVADTIPDEAFPLYLIQMHYGPGVDRASNRNE